MLTNYRAYNILYIYTHVRFDKLGVTTFKTKRTEKFIRIRFII
jgi:hypothetical protein